MLIVIEFGIPIESGRTDDPTLVLSGTEGQFVGLVALAIQGTEQEDRFRFLQTEKIHEVAISGRRLSELTQALKIPAIEYLREVAKPNSRTEISGDSPLHELARALQKAMQVDALGKHIFVASDERRKSQLRLTQQISGEKMRYHLKQANYPGQTLEQKLYACIHEALEMAGTTRRHVNSPTAESM